MVALRDGADRANVSFGGSPRRTIEGGEMALDPLEPPLHFPRQMHAVDYLMFRGEHAPRSRTAMLSVSLLDTVPDLARLREVYDRASRVVVRMRQHVVEPVLPL